jgi:FkbM family methyltransferase
LSKLAQHIMYYPQIMLLSWFLVFSGFISYRALMCRPLIQYVCATSKSFEARLRTNRLSVVEALINKPIVYKTWTRTIQGIEFANMEEDAESMAGGVIADELNRDDYKMQQLQLGVGDTVLDLGTNIGLTAILAARRWPGVRVIGIEPSPYNWLAAQRNIRTMGVQDSVQVLHAALCATASESIKLGHQRENAGGSTLDVDGIGSDGRVIVVEVQCVTLDEILEHYNITYAAFVKLDCEACEYFVVPSLSAQTRARLGRVKGETHEPYARQHYPQLTNADIALTNSIFRREWREWGRETGRETERAAGRVNHMLNHV